MGSVTTKSTQRKILDKNNIIGKKKKTVTRITRGKDMIQNNHG